MTAEPLVSVVVPTFQQADFLAEALRSVLQQTHSNWEAVVVDNESTDHTAAVVDSFADPRIRRLTIANHGIIAASRNLGIERTGGGLVAFLDSDDTWSPTKLARCVAALADDAELVCHAERWVGGRLPERTVEYGPSELARFEPLLLEQNRLSTSAVVVRRATLMAVGGFDTRPEFAGAEDYDLWLRLARRGTSMRFLVEPLGVYRRHESSTSSATERHLAAELAVVRAHLAESTFPAWRCRRRIARCHYSAGRGHHALGRRWMAAIRLARSLSIYPLTIRPWLALLLLLVPGRPR